MQYVGSKQLGFWEINVVDLPIRAWEYAINPTLNLKLLKWTYQKKIGG